VNAPPEIPGPVLLFDGECNLCRRIVRRLHRLDRRGRLHFTPLQGKAAQDFLRARGLPADDFDSLIFVPAWHARATAPYAVRTAGALAALRETGGVGRFAAGLAGVVPETWRDAFYRRVAANRRRLGGVETVPLPADRMLP
jgi:predicted DCC family thiol-disulfide oxidoreductase YuxK